MPVAGLGEIFIPYQCTDTIICTYVHIYLHVHPTKILIKKIICIPGCHTLQTSWDCGIEVLRLVAELFGKSPDLEFLLSPLPRPLSLLSNLQSQTV